VKGTESILVISLTTALSEIRLLFVASLRYLDTFVKCDGAWLFAQRKLYVDWTETRSSHP
jgi:hypothetical protein